MHKKRYKSEQKPDLFVKPIHLKNSSQEHYVSLLREMLITFCKGPAGTGKTFLASYIAIEALLKKQVEKIVLTRPIIATEDIGYLPGDMNEKIHPYILPMLDAIESHLGPTKTKELMADGSVEVIPLAYMRGRSLNKAFIILDEAQNTTKIQMKMLLTRIGFDSQIVVCGDDSQTDLPMHQENGLVWALDRLKGCDEMIGVMEFYSHDIVRSPLIEKIIKHLGI